jgi:hypothetical protein
MPTEMGEVMANLLLIVDAWYELASESAPSRFEPADRVEVLGLLVRLVAMRFHGFRRPPRPGAIAPVLEHGSVGLSIRSPGRVPAGVAAVERELAPYGFLVERSPSDEREVTLVCSNPGGAQVITFPARR